MPSVTPPNELQHIGWIDRAMVSLQSVLRRCTDAGTNDISEGEADRAMMALDAHLLDDIGLSHAEVLFRTSTRCERQSTGAST